MAYVHKLLTKDEEMIGIARLHWIYVLKGIVWFLGLTAVGWITQTLIMRGLSYVADGINSGSLTLALLPLLNFIIFIPMAVGFCIFVFNVIKVLSTEIGMTNRRIIKKTGWLFVKTNNIDIEEIRGENTDTGWFGRFLNYAYIDLDCRFIGDVRIDAIERPNLFMRHLHKQRAEAQDTIRMVTGKSSTQNMVEFVSPAAEGNPNPEVSPPQPQTPEIVPPNPPQEIPPQPAPPQIDPPAPTQPPTKDGLPPLNPPSPYPSKEDPKAQEVKKAQEEQQQQSPQPQQPAAPAPIDAQTVAQVVQQVMPQMAQEVVKQMAEQGLVASTEVKPENDIDTDLIHSFDEARIKDAGNDLQNKLEHAIN